MLHLRALVALAAFPWMACSHPPAQAPPRAAPPGLAPASQPEAAPTDLQGTAQSMEILLSDCYQRALLDRPDTRVELSYALVLARNGSVVDTSIEHQGTCGTLFLMCVESALQSLRFAPNPGGPLAVVRGQLSFAQRNN